MDANNFESKNQTITKQINDSKKDLEEIKQPDKKEIEQDE